VEIMGVQAGVELNLEPPAAFEAMVEELSSALARVGMQLQPGAGGHVMEGAVKVGRITHWEPPKMMVLEWHAAQWDPAEATSMELRFEPCEDGTRVTLENRGWGDQLADNGDELAGWFASEAIAPLFRAMGPSRLGDWITDRRARRPSGRHSRATYRDPIYHRPIFLAILAVLKLRPDDYLLEVGCGGGAFLHDALKSGCKAAAIDHSPDMVKVACEVNGAAIRQGRLEIREADANSLPFADNTFTCAVMTGVFGFITDPVKALSEICRVLAPGGRFALFTGTKKLLGTPAAPEPVASRLHFYEDHELEDLARRAGFAETRFERPDYEPLARKVGVPEEALELYRGSEGGQLLVAGKGR
jgi:ubiquinone/menaquinone biosynthesis C-methylase UbiE